MAFEEIPLDNLDKLTLITRLICYPQGNFSCLKKRIIELKLLGVKSFLKGDKKIIDNFPILGKGTTSIVLKGKYVTDKIVTIKIRRLDSNRDSVIHEAKMLKIANNVNVGPKLITFSKNCIVWEYIDGIPLNIFLGNKKNWDKLRYVLKNLLFQAYSLDKIGLTHLELSRPINHILITKDYKPVIIDFETATLRSRKKNLSQILNFMVFRNNDIRTFLKLDFSLEYFRYLLQRYKEDPVGYFTDIIKIMRLND